MIPLKPDAFVFVHVFRTQPESSEEIVALASEMAHAFTSRQPGYLSAAVHESLDGERVVVYSQWESEEAYRRSAVRALSDTEMRKYRRLLDHLAGAEPRSYRLTARIPRDTAPTIAVGTARATLINIFELFDSHQQRDMLAVVRETAERLSQANCGLVSSNVHVSLDGSAITNYAQWESADAFEAAMRSPELEPLLKKHIQLADPDVHLYDVVEVIPKAGKERAA